MADRPRRGPDGGDRHRIEIGGSQRTREWRRRSGGRRAGAGAGYYRPMPELPEIEVLRRSLEPLLPGDVIEGVRVENPALRERVRTRQLARLVGRRIETLRRRSKYLLVDVSGGRRVAELVPGARLLVLPGTGHEIAGHDLPTLVSAILDLIADADVG